VPRLLSGRQFAMRPPGLLQVQTVSAPRVAAADVGGVGHPVASGGMLPGDSDVDVDAEHAGEQRGWQFGGELEQGGGACLPGLAWAPAGQQPGRGAMVADCGVALAGEVADRQAAAQPSWPVLSSAGIRSSRSSTGTA
jgi:hypothetical protein